MKYNGNALMHLSMLSLRGGGGWGQEYVGHFSIKCPHCRAINIDQIPHHFAINTILIKIIIASCQMSQIARCHKIVWIYYI